jgi:hypothetical protein
MERRKQVRLGPEPVLEVHDHPVEARAAQDFRGRGRAQGREGADERLAREDAAAELAGGSGHPRIMP